MRILLWHVHGSWTTAFVQGEHEYLVPVLPGRPADGRGRARAWDWPGSVQELGPGERRRVLDTEGVDAVLPVCRWRAAGTDVTSLGLALLEAMALGLPVLALPATASYAAVPAFGSLP